ncbi:prepilin-type N-terminal cleavage/methylation domain-containing protein [Helicovermis profundi]|uniref:Prepilin-type N-terminal cleavage/methylation domain-containing protein n=1 Tax=Helicovermis profundi TaxID=3065157 RepID=A0AAU9E4Q0_9FIRM|nr:hypothetical protein HLPR_13110 [Clostridia bacterium S502]
MNKKQINKKKGFTLIELLLVLLVMAVLFGIAIPKMMGLTDIFRLKTDRESARNIVSKVNTLVELGIYDLSEMTANKTSLDYITPGKTPNDSSGEKFYLGEENSLFLSKRYKGDSFNISLIREGTSPNFTYFIEVKYKDPLHTEVLIEKQKLANPVK